MTSVFEIVVYVLAFFGALWLYSIVLVFGPRVLFWFWGRVRS